jgi:hypothetical protein
MTLRHGPKGDVLQTARRSSLMNKNALIPPFMYSPMWVAFLLLLAPVSTFGQSVISSQGSTFENSEISLTWTLGEPATHSMKDARNIVMEGYPQPTLRVSQMESPPEESITASVYPNPTFSELNVQLGAPVKTEARIELYDLQGVNLYRDIIPEGSALHIISMVRFAAGEYVLQILNEEKHSSYQVIKSN